MTIRSSVLAAVVLGGTAALAAPPALLRDVNQYAHGIYEVGEAVATAGKLFAVVVDETAGRELAVVDGTTGAVEILDLAPGNAGSSPYGLTALGDKVLFAATTEDYGWELWSTDGTLLGTQVQDIEPGQTGSFPSNFVLQGNGFVLFSATTTAAGTELYQTDGTSDPSLLDIVLGPGSSSPRAMKGLPGGIIFSAHESAIGYEPWTLSIGGLEPLRNIAPGNASSFPQEFTYLQSLNQIVFSAAGDGLDRELWISNFTDPGTVLLKDIETAGSSDPGDLVLLDNGLVLFRAHTAAAGVELWRTNGTPGGTVSVVDVHPGPTSGLFFGPPVAMAGTRVIAPVYFPDAGVEPAVSDGNGITRLVDGMAGIGWGWSGPDAIVHRRGITPTHAYFALDDGTLGSELWRTDGTPGGTAPVADLLPGPTSSQPVTLATEGETLYLHAYGPGGPAFWKVEASGPPSLLTDLSSSGTDSAGVLEAETVGDRVFFDAFDGVAGRELWSTDGTTDGTQRVADLVPGSVGSGPRELTAAGGRLFFAATSHGHGAGLFLSDGTTAGTRLVDDIDPGPEDVAIHEIHAFGDRVLFTATTAAEGEELWISDGTPTGTHIVRNIGVGPLGSQPGCLATTDARAFFCAYDFGGAGLWITDGTDGGTEKLAEVSVGDAPVRFGSGSVLFAGTDASTDSELWISDGTMPGTHIVADLVEGGGSVPSHVTVAGGRAFFAARTVVSSASAELWVTDGTAANTAQLRQLTDVTTSSFIVEMVPLGDRVVFSVLSYTNASDFREALWVSDGTTDGTHPIDGTCPVFDCSVAELFAFAGSVFFRQDDGTRGIELWQTDGTTAGTRIVADTAPGPASFTYLTRSVAFLGGRIFLGGFEPEHDREPWIFDYDLCPNDDGKVAPGACGCGTADVDADASGITDCLVPDEMRQRIDALVALIEPIARPKGQAERKALRERRLAIRAALDVLTAYYDAHQATFPGLAQQLRKTRKAVLRVAKSARGAKKPKRKALESLGSLRQAVP